MQHTILFVHGMWSTHQVWAPLVEVFRARGHRCIVPDLPHHAPGLTGPPQALGATSLVTYLDFLIDLLEQDGGDAAPVVVGHSMGGLLALLLAGRGEVSGVAAVASAPPAPILLSNHDTLSFFSRVAYSALVPWESPHRPGPDLARENLFPNHAEADAQRMIDGLVWESGRAACEIGMWHLDLNRATHLDVDTVTAPQFVAGAELDRVLPAHLAENIAAALPDARLEIYPGRSHWIIDEPGNDTFVEDLVGFIEGLPARPARPIPHPDPGGPGAGEPTITPEALAEQIALMRRDLSYSPLDWRVNAEEARRVALRLVSLPSAARQQAIRSLGPRLMQRWADRLPEDARADDLIAAVVGELEALLSPRR